MTPRARVIIDNDFAGDPDDLFQVAHHVLSPSVEIPFVICSRLPDFMQAPGPGPGAVERGTAIAEKLLDLMSVDIPVLAGSEARFDAAGVAPLSPAAAAIVAEAMREDTRLPLYFAAGGGLTELAAAYGAEPRIAERLTLVWIGGPDYGPRPETVAPMDGEFNMMVDIAAAQVVFGSSIPIWQVPRGTYSQCIVSWAVLELRIRPLGDFGSLLLGSLEQFVGFLESRMHLNLGETFILGDNPLVLLTALQGSFNADPSSSKSTWRARPVVGADGWYDGDAKGLPPVRVFGRVDTRLMLDDMYAKFQSFAS